MSTTLTAVAIAFGIWIVLAQKPEKYAVPIPQTALRYIFGPHVVSLEEAEEYCKKFKGFIVRDYKSVLLDMIGLPGRPFWYKGSRAFTSFNALVAAFGVPYTSAQRRTCTVFNGYDLVAPVPCDYRALPWCQISVFGVGEAQRRHPSQWVQKPFMEWIYDKDNQTAIQERAGIY
ncbi:hypothetical protein CRM22_008171 [Opisthorchis felineus]|uniref:C-type lectin domain-containing protein n=1 Tax=Opisthorchis felineus TaxID=147828 RepID=A0A4S2LCG3_OPIFE|nr:hypothetical protein CRM22_008171 [Opisthorchis felineus]